MKIKWKLYLIKKTIKNLFIIKKYFFIKENGTIQNNKGKCVNHYNGIEDLYQPKKRFLMFHIEYVYSLPLVDFKY